MVRNMTIKEIVGRFGLEFKGIIPGEGHYLVNTQSGIYYIQRTNCSREGILLSNYFKEHLLKRGFIHIDRYVKVQGKPYLSINGDTYIMKEWIEGRKCSLNNEIEMTIKALANLHSLSKTFKLADKRVFKSDLGKWQEILLKRCEDFKYIKTLVRMKSKKTEIDTLFLKNIENFNNIGKDSINLLQKNNYFEISENNKGKGLICHNNYNYNNILIDRDNNYNIINFDYCKYDFRCLDIANFIRINSNRFYWDYDRALRIIDVYNNESKIEKWELKLMAALLQYPHEFWQISNNYYFSLYPYNKEKILFLLKTIIKTLPMKMKFMDKYCKEFL